MRVTHEGVAAARLSWKRYKEARSSSLKYAATLPVWEFIDDPDQARKVS